MRKQTLLCLIPVFFFWALTQCSLIEADESFAFITFDKNDVSASGSMNMQTMVQGETENLSPCEFKKEKWQFKGWATTSTGTAEYEDGAPFTAENTKVTLYAKWDPPEEFSVGDRGPGGGWVFYDKGSYSDGWRYLEASIEDEMSSQWGTDGLAVPGASATVIGTGNENTIAIVSGDTKEYKAADKCHNFTMENNGEIYDDWFLPSRDELQEMYEILFLNDIGAFSSISNYWSSSQYNAEAAWGIDFSDGTLHQWYKWGAAHVRPVRSF
jgi:hypothetical protein